MLWCVLDFDSNEHPVYDGSLVPLLNHLTIVINLSYRAINVSDFSDKRLQSTCPLSCVQILCACYFVLSVMAMVLVGW